MRISIKPLGIAQRFITLRIPSVDRIDIEFRARGARFKVLRVEPHLGIPIPPVAFKLCACLLSKEAHLAVVIVDAPSIKIRPAIWNA